MTSSRKAGSDGLMGSIPDCVATTEQEARIALAATYRLVALYGWDDLIFTHISARVPEAENQFLMNPYGMGFDEITASSLLKVDVEGNKIGSSPYGVNPAGFTIHSAVHMHHGADCVIHTHSDDGVAVSAQEPGLLPLSQTAMTILGDLSYHEYEGIALDHDERERLIDDLGDAHCMILRNHGLLTSGASCADAFLRLFFLERACTMQVRALNGQVKPNMPPQGVPEKTAQQIDFRRNDGIGRLAWPALLRKLDRENPGYRD